MQLKPESQSPKPEELEGFVREANEVKVLTQQAGWGIIERDVGEYRFGIGNKLAYLNPKRPEYEEARILFLASDKLLALINDYESNREKALELLGKLENPNLTIALDVDNE